MEQFKRQDFIGFVLFVAGLILFIMGLSWGGVAYRGYLTTIFECPAHVLQPGIART